MCQRSVEAVVGRLATDEAFRLRFVAGRAAVLRDLVAQGVELTPVEVEAIAGLDLEACEEFARRLDPRIQKVCLRRPS